MTLIMKRRRTYYRKGPLNSIECPECGFVNFLSAGECKRCHVRFQPEPIPNASSSVSEAPREPTDEDPQEAPLGPLPDYFNDEPASFSAPVILFAIGLAVTVLGVGYQLKLYFAFMKSSTWDAVTDPGGLAWLYIPILEPLVYMELIIKCAVMLAALALLILLLGKSWSFLKWVRVYLLSALLYQVLEIVALLSLRASLPGKDTIQPFTVLLDKGFWVVYALLAFGSVSLTLIWFAYFDTSERVKKIFIN